mgnify:CR=1 FL=1
MSRKRFLYWTGKEVREWNQDEAFALREHLAEGGVLPLCVDLDFSEPEGRYGQITRNTWLHTKLEDFPKEFRVHLLLLGVS